MNNYHNFSYLNNNKSELFQLSPIDIKNIRRSYDLSQASFANMLGISVRTLQNYEIGHRAPNGSFCALLKIAKDHPNLFLHNYLDYTKSRSFFA